MKKIQFTCNKTWHEMESISNNSKFCQDCRKCVRDYASVESCNPKVKSECGRFNLSQIESFSRKYSITPSKAAQLSLLALLGLSLSYNNLSAQQTVDEKKSTIEVANDQLIINGRLLNKETKEVLGYGAIELYNRQQLIAVAFTNKKGDFLIRVDTSRHKLDELQVVFDGDRSFRNGEYLLSDTTSIANDRFKNIEVELEVKVMTDSYPEYFITGMVQEDKIKCAVPKKTNKE